MHTASYELYKHPLHITASIWHYTRTGSPRAVQRALHFRESAHGGHPQTITEAWEAKNWRMLWLLRLETGSLGASDGILAATRVDISSFSGLEAQEGQPEDASGRGAGGGGEAQEEG